MHLVHGVLQCASLCWAGCRAASGILWVPGTLCLNQAKVWRVQMWADLVESRPWLSPHIRTPAAFDPPTPTRPRPLIYVYDLPPIFNTRLVQYRVDRNYCFYRAFDDHNNTMWTIFTYYIETAFHEMLLQARCLP